MILSAKFLIKFTLYTALIAVIGLCIWYAKPYVMQYSYDRSGPIGTFVTNIEKNTGITRPPPPCSQPIVYRIGMMDPSFGLTKEKFIADINEAANIWEKPFGKKLFQFDLATSTTIAEDDMPINLIYDYRQQVTDALNTVGATIDSETPAYNALKAKYNNLTAQYSRDKAALTALKSAFDAAQNQYNSQVNYWNSRGGAPSSEFATLNNEKASLEAQVVVLNQHQDALNALATTINATSAEINKYVNVLNAQARQYNAISSTTGEQFEEGQFVSDSTGARRIDIFQYMNKTKLIRLLAHELGHSLGLGHVASDTSAIMYPVNQANTLALTQNDIAALITLCGISQLK